MPSTARIAGAAGLAAPDEALTRPLRRPAITLLALAAGLLLWRLAAALTPDSRTLLPAPEVVLVRLWDLAARGILWPHLVATLTEAGLGFLVGAAAGLTLGYVVAKAPVLEAFLAPYVAGAQAVPVVAIAPLMVLWFGLDLLPKVLTCALIVFFPILVSTVAGLRGVDRTLIEAAQTFGAGRWAILGYVEIPLALRSLLGGLKLGLTLSMTGAVVGEFIAADRGLGYLLTAGRSNFDTPLVFAALLTLAAVTIGAYILVNGLEARLIDWE
ncbi:MAG TPA: ABC transporter permease [Chloroflexia bacterium]|nr:ABC transporter permease [Chloroflexia bacterium]